MDPIVKWLKQELLAYIDSGVSDDDCEHAVSVSHCNILRWFDALDRLSAQQREPVVRVKELEWGRQDELDIEGYFAPGRSGWYYVVVDEDSAFGSILTSHVEAHEDLCMKSARRLGRFSSWEEAKSAAQADYEQRIMAAIEIQISDGGSPGPSPLAVAALTSDPASGRSQPSPDVSVDELADALIEHSLLFHDKYDAARALLARYKIERLDRLASSGRR